VPAGPTAPGSTCSGSSSTAGTCWTTAIKNVGYLYVPEDRRDHTEVAETLYLHNLI